MDSKTFLFCKFGEEKWLRELQKGKLYCKNLKYYSQLEKQSNDTAMGDYREGKHIETQCQVKLYEYGTTNLVLDLKGANIAIGTEESVKMPVFCLVGLRDTDIERIDNEDKEMYLFKPKETLSEILKEKYWNSALIIRNPLEFVKRIVNRCNEEGIEYKFGFVNYTDMSINYLDREESIESNFQNVAFWKDNQYKKQYEYRMAFINKMVEDNFILDVGDLSDITTLLDEEKLKKAINAEYIAEFRK